MTLFRKYALLIATLLSIAIVLAMSGAWLTENPGGDSLGVGMGWAALGLALLAIVWGVVVILVGEGEKEVRREQREIEARARAHARQIADDEARRAARGLAAGTVLVCEYGHREHRPGCGSCGHVYRVRVDS